MPLLSSAMNQGVTRSDLRAETRQQRPQLSQDVMEKAQWSWYRLTQKVLVMVHAATARKKALLMLSDEARHQERVAMMPQPAELSATHLGMLRIVRGFVLAKKRSSQLRGEFTHMESTCQHLDQMVMFRGGRGHPWATCTSCGSRWDRWQLGPAPKTASSRFPKSASQSGLCPLVPDRNSVSVYGKYRGQLNATMIQDGAYCAKLVEMAELDGTSAPSDLLQAYMAIKIEGAEPAPQRRGHTQRPPSSPAPSGRDRDQPMGGTPSLPGSPSQPSSPGHATSVTNVFNIHTPAGNPSPPAAAAATGSASTLWVETPQFNPTPAHAGRPLSPDPPLGYPGTTSMPTSLEPRLVTADLTDLKGYTSGKGRRSFNPV